MVYVGCCCAACEECGAKSRAAYEALLLAKPDAAMAKTRAVCLSLATDPATQSAAKPLSVAATPTAPALFHKASAPRTAALGVQMSAGAR